MNSHLVQLASHAPPDQIKIFPKGRFELLDIAGKTFGRATYEPGWKWSEHVGSELAETHCRISHFGYVISGSCAVAFEDGSIAELREGTFFHIPAIPHDSWVIGDQPYVSLHLDHPERYAAPADADRT